MCMQNLQTTLKRGTPDDYALARKLSEEAIALDPEYPAPYHILALTHLVDAILGTSKSPPKSMGKAFKLAQKAVAMDDSLAPSHHILGMVYRFKRELEKAIADLDMTVATTAKTRDARVEYTVGSALPNLIRSKGKAVHKIGLVFGREESGLTNEEIRICDLVSSIPMKVPYPSLNLGQSVMLYAYIMASAHMANHSSTAPSMNEEGFRAMMDKSEKLLKELDMDTNPALYHRILERIASLGEDDIHLVHSILNRLLK